MPDAPVISASIDTSMQVIKKNVKEIGTAGYYLYHMRGFSYGKYPDRYWPFFVNVDVSGGNNCLALDLLKTEFSDYSGNIYWWGIGSSDMSILLENGMNTELLRNENVDLYLYSMLMTAEFDYVPRNFYAAVDESTKKQNNKNSAFQEDPDFEKTTTKHSLILRVRNITPASYRYHHSLSLQYIGDIFNEQPATVKGNIEGGFGIFSVYNTTNIPLLEWETY